MQNANVKASKEGNAADLLDVLLLLREVKI